MREESKNILLALARASIEENFTHQTPRIVQRLNQEVPLDLLGKEGAFVTLRKKGDGKLRGCIGNVVGTTPLYLLIYRLAKEAAFGDRRFSKLTYKELSEIEIEISILTPPILIESPHDIVVGRDGVILTCKNRRALFLPQVALEQNWDLETMLDHLAIKASLSPKGWQQSSCQFEVFQATHFKE